MMNDMKRSGVMNIREKSDSAGPDSCVVEAFECAIVVVAALGVCRSGWVGRRFVSNRYVWWGMTTKINEERKEVYQRKSISSLFKMGNWPYCREKERLRVCQALLLVIKVSVSQSCCCTSSNVYALAIRGTGQGNVRDGMQLFPVPTVPHCEYGNQRHIMDYSSRSFCRHCGTKGLCYSKNLCQSCTILHCRSRVD